MAGKVEAMEEARTAGKIMALTTLQLFAQPDLVAEATMEFRDPVKTRVKRS